MSHGCDVSYAYHWCTWQVDDKCILYLKWMALIWVECPTLTLHRGDVSVPCYRALWEIRDGKLLNKVFGLSCGVGRAMTLLSQRQALFYRKIDKNSYIVLDLEVWLKVFVFFFLLDPLWLVTEGRSTSLLANKNSCELDDVITE